LSRYLTCVACLVTTVAHAQLPPEKQPDLPIDPAIADRLIEGIAASLKDSYVFPDAVPDLEKAIRAHLNTGEYKRFRSAAPLVEHISRQLQDAAHDRHLRLVYYSEALPAPGSDKPPTADERAAWRAKQVAEGAAHNFGFERAELLEGNIGYLKLHSFEEADLGGETAVAAMNFLAHARALIFDLRENHGGDPGMIALILSYLFEEPTHLNDIFWRPDNSTGQYWTSGHVSGSRFTGDVYVLISGHTFSAGEEFAYDLQTQKRATIVGEPSAGGAHPITIHRLDDHFAVLVPSGRAINPITHTDWEGVGVKPDVAAAPELALKTAQLAALEKLHAEAAVIASVKKELALLKTGAKQ